jgi:hypothetical protein
MNPRAAQKQLAAVCVVLALLAGTGACIKNSNLTAPQLASYQVNRTIAALAEINKGVAQSTIKLNQLKLIQPDLTNEILTYNRRVAVAVKDSEAVLQAGGDWAVVAPKVLRLLQELPLPQKVVGFLNAPATDQGVLALISSISTVQILITQSITEVKR